MKDLKEKFIKYFGEGDDIRSFFAPGRVNLIGEHIDYNGGFVFPAALTIGITAIVRKNNSDVVRMISLNIEGEVKVDLNKEILYQEDNWGNYPKGVFKYLMEEGYKLTGCDILYYSSLPDGAGLSSSAALEVLTTYMMLSLIGENVTDRVKIAKFSQYVENNFVKVNCGIMDQFSVAMGKENFAILLDCNTLKYKYVTLNLEGYSLVIMNTNKQRELADSKYNERRRECDKVLSIINEHERVSNLCDVTLEQIRLYIKDETLKKRARHVVTENKRVLDAVKSLDEGNLLQFASLLTHSHMSLKYDYEVSGFELDTIVEEALKFNDCIGARMTGAGFGGCAIAIVKSESVEMFKFTIYTSYKNKTKRSPTFYESKIGAGVNENLLPVEKIS